MYERNCFITLTYSDEHLKSDRLVYRDFQLFMKLLRKQQNEPIGFFVTGEYGEKNKRPHWHAIVFNWCPGDLVYKFTNKRGDKLFESVLINRLWGHGDAQIGSVSFESAGYVARYSAKKLVHGYDGTHEYNPISKKSSKHAIGKKWLEKYWRDAFNNGFIVIKRDDQYVKTEIPRYYEKWLKEKHPSEWVRYVTQVKLPKVIEAEKKEREEKKLFLETAEARLNKMRGMPLTKNEVKEKILEESFKRLQSRLQL